MVLGWRTVAMHCPKKSKSLFSGYNITMMACSNCLGVVSYGKEPYNLNMLDDWPVKESCPIIEVVQPEQALQSQNSSLHETCDYYSIVFLMFY